MPPPVDWCAGTITGRRDSEIGVGEHRASRQPTRLRLGDVRPSCPHQARSAWRSGEVVTGYCPSGGALRLRNGRPPVACSHGGRVEGDGMAEQVSPRRSKPQAGRPCTVMRR
jgi:hypothetical protein